jgi:hypothetical protein
MIPVPAEAGRSTSNATEKGCNLKFFLYIFAYLLTLNNTASPADPGDL